MTIPIIVPELGESVLEATVHQWLRNEGEFVKAGEALVELETDKVNLEVGAQRDGKLAQILAGEGQDVKVGDVLGQLDEEVVAPGGEPVERGAKASGREEPAPAQAEEGAGRLAPAGLLQRNEAGTRGDSRTPTASPLAQRIAEEEKVNLVEVQGSGPGGRIIRTDVERYLEAHETAPESHPPAAPSVKPAAASPEAGPASGEAPGRIIAAGRGERRMRMTRRRRTIAQRLVEAQHSAAMLTTFNEVDMSAIMDLRSRRGPDFLERHGVKLGIMSFFVKASIGALKAFPRVNAELQGEEIVLKSYYDIGIAIGAEEGLVVPVVRDADRLSFAEIERQIRGYIEKSGQSQLSIEDLVGGTFTITNGGVFGSLLSTPILNPPQVGILGMHKIEQRPVAVEGQVVIRPMMYVALSYDHRVVDGREAVQFLAQAKQLLEDPERLLLDG